MRQYHIGLDDGEAGEYVLMPGDPGRCELIASRFDNPVHVQSNREYTTYSGTLDGVRVSAVSHGIGAPSTAIAAEELYKVGARTLIRVGSAGSMQPGQRIDDLVVATAAVRAEGVTPQYAPMEVPAVAHVDVVGALRAAAEERGFAHHVGVVVSNDSFYSEMEADRMPLGPEIKARWSAYVKSGVLASEMECSALFIIGSVLRIRTGGVVVCVNETPVPEDMPHPGALPLDNLIDTAALALRRLIAADRAAGRVPAAATA